MNLALRATSTWTAAGRGAAAILDRLQRRRPAFRPVPPYPADGLDPALCAPVADLDRERPAHALLRTVVAEALARAALPAGTRVGLVAGTTSGDISGPWERWHRAVLAGEEAGPEPSRDGPVRDVARELGLAPTATVSVACASSTAAFAVAAGWLAEDRVEAVVVAGFDALSVFVHAGFAGLGALSRRGTRPFAADRDGLVLGEGAAALVLDRGDLAAAPPLAWLRGIGLADDAFHMSAPHREGRGAAAAMGAALAAASLSPDAVDLVSVHGTGTVFNDAMEARALRAVFGDRPLALHDVKQVVGHTLGAAGAVEAAVLTRALADGAVPPPPPAVDPELGLRLGPPDRRPPAVGLSTNSAFGGANAALVVATEPGPEDAPRRPVRRLATAEVAIPPGPLRWREAWPDAPERFRRLNRYVRLGLLAVRDLRAAHGAPFPDGTGLVLASPAGCRATDLRYHRRLVERGPAQASRLDFIYTIPGAPAAEAAILWDLRGPQLVLVGPMEEAEAEARRLVALGLAEALVALAVDAPDEARPGAARAALLAAGEAP